MKRLHVLALAGVVALAACSDSSPIPLAPTQPDLALSGSEELAVTNARNSGGGSFRAAVEKANQNSRIRKIKFQSGVGVVALTSPVVYTGRQSLELEGEGAVLDGAKLAPTAAATFVATGGADLKISELTVRNAPQQGLAIEVPASATGIKRYTLIRVQALGNGGHGIVINDQVDPDDVANKAGSAAGLEVAVIDSRFADNGFGALDRDGLRVNEGGLGDLKATVTGTIADHNGADGIEFDERDQGDVRFTVSGTQITRNGSYDVTLADLDDGFDVDENDDGGLYAVVTGSSANDNYEEGFDFNENDAGDFDVTMTDVEASRNLEEGIDFEEDDDFQGGGDLITRLTNVIADGNGPGGDAGLKIRERGDGNIDARVDRAQTTGNKTGGINIREQGNGNLLSRIEDAVANGNGLAGILVREDDAGNLTTDVVNATVNDNTNGAVSGSIVGIDIDENGTGDLAATVSGSTVTNNEGAGVRADQQLVSGLGVGALAISGATLTGNNGGGTQVTVNAGVVATILP